MGPCFTNFETGHKDCQQFINSSTFQMDPVGMMAVGASVSDSRDTGMFLQMEVGDAEVQLLNSTSNPIYAALGVDGAAADWVQSTAEF